MQSGGTSLGDSGSAALTSERAHCVPRGRATSTRPPSGRLRPRPAPRPLPRNMASGYHSSWVKQTPYYGRLFRNGRQKLPPLRATAHDSSESARTAAAVKGGLLSGDESERVSLQTVASARSALCESDAVSSGAADHISTSQWSCRRFRYTSREPRRCDEI